MLPNPLTLSRLAFLKQGSGDVSVSLSSFMLIHPIDGSASSFATPAEVEWMADGSSNEWIVL